MANDELIALLKSLQGSGASRGLNTGLLSQLPSLIASTVETKPAAGESGVGAVASAVLRGVGGGLTLLPVVGSLLRLFGAGREKDELPALEKFELPAPIRAEAGLSKSGESFLIDRGAGDQIRVLQRSGPAASARLPLNSGFPAMPVEEGRPVELSATGRTASESRVPLAPTITVNVQAMDSQSFLDRREDIARAVREAMLQSHSLNDVVSEL